MDPNGERFIAMCLRKYPKYVLRLCSYRDYLRFLFDRHYTLRFRIANLILRDRLRVCSFLLLSSRNRKDPGWMEVHRTVCNEIGKAFGFNESYLREHTCLYDDGYDIDDWYGRKFKFHECLS